MKKIKVFLAIALLSLVAISCKKTTPAGTSTMAIRMTDAPGNFSAVYIDLQSVVVTGSTDGDVTFNTHAGIYNLLDFANGMDTLIATGSLQTGSVEQVRLVLGPNNSVMVNGTSYPLSTPSAMQSGLKLQVHQTLQAGVAYSMVLDFDAGQSIVLQGNGTYALKPVIRTVETAISGSISGSVTPIGSVAFVTATSSTDTLSSVTQANGQFIVQGVPAGTYSVTITPPSPLRPVVVGNVIVSTGASTSIGTINL
jgi:hypothetical protein